MDHLDLHKAHYSILLFLRGNTLPWIWILCAVSGRVYLHMGSSEELVKVIKEMRASVLQQSYMNSQGNEVPPLLADCVSWVTNYAGLNVPICC